MKAFIRKIINRIPVLKTEVDFIALQRSHNDKDKIARRKEMNSFYSQFLKKGSLCFDVGGNVGDFTEVFCEVGARTICIEPQKDCFKLLQKRFKNNSNVVLIRKGLAEQEGQRTLYLANAHTISSMSKNWINEVKKKRFKEYNWNKQTMVDVTTLDNLINIYGCPDFCKIDVEGFELEVLQGLHQKIKFISMEFTKENFQNCIKAIDHLNSLGKIEVNFLPGDSMQFVNSTWYNPESMIVYLQKMPDELSGDLFIKYIDI